MLKTVILDTNVLMSDVDLSMYEKVYIPFTVLEELDKHKESSDDNKAFKGRRAIRNIRDSKNVEFLNDFSYALPSWVDRGKNDNLILGYAKEKQVHDKDCVFLTGDLNLYQKSLALDIRVEWFEVNCRNDITSYKGWKEISLNSQEINQYYNSVENGEIKFLTNEYLILNNVDTNETTEERYNGKKFVRLSLPSSKIVKGLNSQQRCALDLLFNRDIPVKVITGKFGSGKTLLSTKVGLHLIEKEIYKKMLFFRNPIPADGTDIGYLKGTKEEKIHEYMKPFLQYIESDKINDYADYLLRNEKIGMDVISFLKGVNIEDAYVICDEAEDLNTKLIKLTGSRVGRNTVIVFMGDYKQAENKYKYDNGLLSLINGAKGNTMVGIVDLPEDLRSEASKIFADL